MSDDHHDRRATDAKPLPPGVDRRTGLGHYWNQTVSALASVEPQAFAPDAAERHRIYSLLTLALIHAYFNGNKNGPDGDYPWRAGQRRANDTYAGGTYLGHNIACIAVDENGAVVDFDFNHNEIFNSSAEHAEARLVRRVFSLNQIYDNWELWGPAKGAVPYGNMLSGLTVYTSLESCAQCSGIMTLANTLKVVFLQSDPGQHLIGNILYNLTKPIAAPAKALAFTDEQRPKRPDKYGAPEPIDARAFGFEYTDALDHAYQAFAAAVGADRPFHVSPTGKVNASRSITSFLCTDAAQQVFAQAAGELHDFTCRFPDFKPVRSDGEQAGVKSNQAALDHVRGFLAHATTLGQRATPHR